MVASYLWGPSAGSDAKYLYYIYYFPARKLQGPHRFNLSSWAVFHGTGAIPEAEYTYSPWDSFKNAVDLHLPQWLYYITLKIFMFLGITISYENCRQNMLRDFLVIQSKQVTLCYPSETDSVLSVWFLKRFSCIMFNTSSYCKQKGFHWFHSQD